MRILYVAKHNNGQNDDEGAITYALRRLGHKVIRVSENRAADAYKIPADFCLFHKFSQADYLRRIKGMMPLVFWYFDLVDTDDPTLYRRCFTRRSWMETVLPLVDIGFCTDGDWVNKDTTDKLVHLRQGADERLQTEEILDTQNKRGILFTGISRLGGLGRVKFVESMKITFGGEFTHIPQGCYGIDLANTIANYKIIVAPNSPITNNYWSNRVYITLTHNAFLLHPYIPDLAVEYKDNEHLVFYEDWNHLVDLIEHYKQDDLAEERNRISQQGRAHTFKNFTYRHRCDFLIETVTRRLNLT